MNCCIIEGNLVKATAKLHKLPEGYIEVPDNVFTGDDIRFLNKDYTRKTLEECFKEGLLVDIKEADEIFLWFNGKYRAVKDYTSADYWYKETKEKVVFQYSEIPDETMTNILPLTGDYVVWGVTLWTVDDSELKENRIVELKDLLTSSDYKVIKSVEFEVSLDELYPTAKRERQIIRDEINLLEKQLEELADARVV